MKPTTLGFSVHIKLFYRIVSYTTDPGREEEATVESHQRELAHLNVQTLHVNISNIRRRATMLRKTKLQERPKPLELVISVRIKGEIDHIHSCSQQTTQHESEHQTQAVLKADRNST